jgi:beta-glucosidase
VVPLQRLIGFERVMLKAGERSTLKFTITPEMMSFYNEDGKLTLEPGEFRVEIGGCSPGSRGQALGAPKPVVAMFEVN